MMTLKSCKTWCMSILAFLLVLVQVPLASAAEDAVAGIEFDKASPFHLYVSDPGQQVKVIATYEGTTTKKDVTADAVWASSNPKIITVNQGLLTALDKTAEGAKVIVTAKYKGFTISMDVVSTYYYKSLELNYSGTLDLTLGQTDTTVEAFVQDFGDNPVSFDVTADKETVWSSSNNDIVTVEKGKLTPVSKGKATITAKYKGLTDKIDVNVSLPYSALAIDPADMQEYWVGQDADPLKAIATQTLGNQTIDVTEDATWKSSNTGVATVEKGKLKLLGPGVSQITVEHLGASAESTVVVRLQYQVMNVTSEKGTHFFFSENPDPLQLKAEVMNDASNPRDVTQTAEWTSSNPVVATVSKGVVSLKGVGTAVIKASIGGVVKETTFNVYQNVTDLTVDETPIDLFKAEVKALPAVKGKTITGTDSDVSDLVKWTSSNSEIVAIENGKMTAKKTGTVELTASIAQKTWSKKITVNVKEKVLLLLSETSSISMVVGNTVPLPKIAGYLEDGTEIAAVQNVTWKSSSPNLLVKDGNVKALVETKASLTGTYLNKTITIPVTVEQEIVKFEVDPESLTLNPGKSKSIKVTGTYKNGKKASLASKIEWTSSAAAVASVSGSYIKALTEGTTKVTGSYQGKWIEITVTVVPKLLKLDAPEKKFTLGISGTESLKALAVYDTGKETDVTLAAVWTSSKKDVVTVDKGKIVALKKGTATIKATFEKKTITFNITVK